MLAVAQSVLSLSTGTYFRVAQDAQHEGHVCW